MSKRKRAAERADVEALTADNPELALFTALLETVLAWQKTTSLPANEQGASLYAAVANFVILIDGANRNGRGASRAIYQRHPARSRARPAVAMNQGRT